MVQQTLFQMTQRTLKDWHQLTRAQQQHSAAKLQAAARVNVREASQEMQQAEQLTLRQHLALGDTHSPAHAQPGVTSSASATRLLVVACSTSAGCC